MDIQLHYTETGTGEPLVLLHGNGEDSGYFVHQIEFFSPHRRVLAVDTRGHGQSPRGSAPFTIRQFAEDLLAFLDERGIEQTDLLGFSDGANIALIFALRHPERVRRLILNGANLDPAGVKRSVQMPIELGYRMASLFAKRSANAKRNAELLGLMVNDPMIPAEELGKVTMPTLVIAGTKDMIKEKHTRAIADALPNARLVFVPGDHFIANKNPEEFNRAVADFLAETEE
ncbi:MAG: alpha/beta fold hydrolase [Oscillospiraceae bacterium]